MVGALIITLLMTFILAKPILISYGKWLAPSTPTPTGDVAVALSGENRIQTAATLLVRGQVKAIYSDSDIEVPVQEDKNLLAEIIKEYNLSSEQIYWGGKVKNTFEEALAFQRTMTNANFNYNQIVIVSDRYHLRRSQWIFSKVLGSDIKIQTYATPADTEMSNRYWWHHKKSREWVKSETKKLIFYWFYYGVFNNKIPLSPRDFATAINKN